jgi:DNA gyrase subunit A
MDASKPAVQETIIPVRIEEEMKRSYIDYAMSVIVGRALPDVRDGLKPVHRRILFAMHEMGITSAKPYKKSARIVGEVLGKYHPHGDTAVYDALVRMVQDFSMRYPLIDGQGNFGSVDGDSAAAMRYTEARLSRIAEEILADIDKETVDFVPNFDDTLQEPTVLPAKLPNLLLNGSSGIAVGMATNIPPHNLGEVIDGVVLLIDEPEADIDALMKVIPGPDFPTGGFVVGGEGIREAYATGRGTIKMRARASVEEGKAGKQILITEIPYMVNKAKLIESIADLIREKKIEGVGDLRDESDREGMRIVLELRGSALPEIVLNRLYKHTQMESTFGVINLALVEGEPRVLTLKETLEEYLRHRVTVVRRRSQFELDRAERRAHILEGLRIALGQIDKVIQRIKASKTVEEAREALQRDFTLTEIQAQAILDMKLQRLTSLEREKIDQEHANLLKEIARLKQILGSEKEIRKVVRGELLELKERYSDVRRTVIIEAKPELGIEDLIPEEEMVINITNSGYIKRTALSTYRMQRRGGKGIIGIETKEEDYLKDLFIASTHDYLLSFSNKGKVYWLKVYEIPEAGRYSRGKFILNLLDIGEGERITANIPIREFDDEHFLFMATAQGIVKKTPLSAFSNPRRGGIIAITLSNGDELVDVRMTDGNQEIILGSRFGKAIRFSETGVRPMGRTARGVKGISLRPKDRVIGMEVMREGIALLAVTENGYGKRTRISDYPLQRRGGKGVINIIPSLRNGPVVGIVGVEIGDEVMITTKEGIHILITAKSVPLMGRNTQGVRLIRLGKEDTVAAAARVVREEE